jgi:hypothetical protein
VFDRKTHLLILATPLGKKYQISKNVQSNPGQMGLQSDLNMNNIITMPIEDLTPKEQ